MLKPPSMLVCFHALFDPVCIFQSLVFLGLAQRLSKRNRSFHTFAYCLMLIPPIGYTAMLSGFGIEEFGAPHSDRCFFTGRWAMLLLEVPLLVTTAGLLAGVVAFDLSIVAISSFLSIACGLLGGLITTDTRWVMFALATLFGLPVLRSCWNRFNLKEGDLSGYDHEYTSIIAGRLNVLCTCLVAYLTVTLVFWVLVRREDRRDEADCKGSHVDDLRLLVSSLCRLQCQGTNLMRSPVELVILGIVDLLMTSMFCLALLSDRESIEKMSEMNSRSS
jgi:hypothetical protein